jgi:hypothetical protein
MNQRWWKTVVLLVAGCAMEEPSLSLVDSVGDDPTGELRRARMNIRVTVVGQGADDLKAFELADHVAADCDTTFGSSSPFDVYAPGDLFGSPEGSAWSCQRTVAAMHVALCVSSRLLEASSTVDDMDIVDGQTTIRIHPQNNDGQTALAEEAFKYARWATVLAGENLREAAGRLNPMGRCTAANLAALQVGGSGDNPPGSVFPLYSESIPMILAEGTYIAQEAGYKANAGNMAAADAEFSLNADTGAAADLAWGAGVLSRARGGHVLLGGTWDSGILEERFSDGVAAKPDSPCVAIELTRDAEIRARDLIAESGMRPEDVFNLTSVTAEELVEGFGIVDADGVAERLGVIHNRESTSLDPMPLEVNAFFEEFNITAADFNAARAFMAQQARAFDRSPTQQLPARPMVDSPTGMPRTEPTRYAATGSDASPMPDEYYRTFVTDTTDTDSHSASFTGTASVVPSANYGFGAKFTDSVTGEESRGGLVQLIDYATSVAYDTSASTGLPTTLPLGTREALGTFLADAVRERRGRLESCYRYTGSQHILRVRVMGFNDPTAIKIVENSAGVSCAVNGHIDSAPCEVVHSSVAGSPVLGTPFTSGETGFRDFVEITLNPTVAGKRYYIVRRLPGSHGGAGSYESLGSIQPVLSGTTTTNWAWCHFDPIVGDAEAIAAAALAPSPTVCTMPETPCTSLRNARLPLEDELTDDGDQYETSWRHYLNLAESAANHADQLGEDLITAGQAIDERIESATEGLEEICGGPIDLQGIITDSFSSPSAIGGSCAGMDGTPCGTAGHICISRQCVRDALRVAEATAMTSPTSQRLTACLSSGAVTDYVALGNEPVCIWRSTTNHGDICSRAGTTDPTATCPYRQVAGGCPTPSLSPGYEHHTITATLDIFNRDEEGERRGERPAAPCADLRTSRDWTISWSGGVDQAAQNVIESGFFELSYIQRLAERIGYTGDLLDYGSITLDGAPIWTLGDPFATPPRATSWPCGPAAGVAEGCLSTTGQQEDRQSLFCSYTDQCDATSTAGRLERVSMNRRLAWAAFALRAVTGVGFEAIRTGDCAGYAREPFGPVSYKVLPDLRRVVVAQASRPRGDVDDFGTVQRTTSGLTYCIEVPDGAPEDPDNDWSWTGNGLYHGDGDHCHSDCILNFDGPVTFRALGNDVGRRTASVVAQLWAGMAGGDGRRTGRRGLIRDVLVSGPSRAEAVLPAGAESAELTGHLRFDRSLSAGALLDGLELVCEASKASACSFDLSQPPSVASLVDLEFTTAYLGCLAARIEETASLDVLPNVPTEALDATGRPVGLSGARGAANGRIAGAIIGLRSYPRALADEVRGLSEDMDALRAALGRNDIRRDLADVELWQTVSTQLASCGGGLVNSFGSLVSGSGGGAVSGSLVGCANAITAVSAAFESNQLVHADVDLSDDMDLSGFRTSFHDRITRLRRLADNLQANGVEVRAALAETEAARQRGQRLLSYANLMGGDAGGRHFAVNTVTRRRYNTLRRRYENAHTYAVRMSHLARLAVEQRIGIPLHRLSTPMSLVEAPSTWADKLCTSSGIDYARIRDESELVVEGDHYADAYIGDYVRRLGQVVESYRLDFPFQNSQDTAIISMRDDIIRARAWCDAPVGNRLAFSGELDVAVDPETADPVWDQFRCTPLGDGTIKNCVAVAPLASTAAVDRPIPAFNPELSPVRGYRVTFRPDAGESYNTNVALGQAVTLEAGTYLLSWYGRTLGGSPLAFQDAVKVQNLDGSAIATSAVITFPIEVGTTEWGRRWVRFTLPATQGVVVAIVPATSVNTTHSVELAALMLERAAPVVPQLSMGACADHTDCPSGAQCVASVGCQPIPREFAATSQAGVNTLPVCEDTTGTAFRGRWRRGCERVCPDGIGGACTEGDERCFWETRFNLSLEAIERGRLFSHAGFAYGNYNYRFDSIALNFVGSATRVCENEARPDTCYASAFVPYSIQHNGPFWVRNHWGEEYDAPLFVGNIEHGRGLAMERYITNPIGSADRTLLADYYHREFRGRPLAGDYTIRIWEGEGVNIEGIEDIQIVLDYRYWTRFE